MNSSPAREAREIDLKLKKLRRLVEEIYKLCFPTRKDADYMEGWNAALDAAARMAENWSVDAQSDCQDIAAAILALKGEQS